MLFRVWANDPHRPTRDLDLLGQGEPSPERCVDVFREICQVGVPDDGIIFVPETVVAERIKEDQEYEGVRVTLMSHLENARIPIQVDIGFGDAVVPSPTVLDYPTLLLGQPAPRLRVYPMSVVVAEKLEAIFNSAFERRGTELNAEKFKSLLVELDSDSKKHQQWSAFINKSGVASAPEFSAAVQIIERFMGAPVLAAQNKPATGERWEPGGGWKESGTS